MREGSVVTVTATANLGYTFSSWSGDCTGSSLLGHHGCRQDRHGQLHGGADVRTDHGGQPVRGGTIIPAAGAHTYNQGTIVPVTATATPGYTFSSWSGACTGTVPAPAR